MELADKNVKLSLVAAEEQDKLSRRLLSWLNEYPGLPAGAIGYEFLREGVPSMALSTIQGAYKTRQYVLGGYEAQYQFKILYRLQPGGSDNNRLKADELLDRLGDWAAARGDLPDFGEGIRCRRIAVDSRSSLFGRYENGDEDHQILMTMTYEVI